MLTFAAPSRQLTLLEVQPVFRIPTNAHARNAYGAAAQDIVCAALNLYPIPIDGTKEVCFDAQDKGGKQCEIKSVHQSAKVVIYDWRMAKEATVPDSQYIILAHRVRRHRDGQTLYQAFADGGLEAWVVSTPTVHEIAKREPLRKVAAAEADDNPRHGYNRKGYRDGYRNVPMVNFRAVLCEAGLREFVLYGIPFKVNVRVEDRLLGA